MKNLFGQKSAGGQVMNGQMSGRHAHESVVTKLFGRKDTAPPPVDGLMKGVGRPTQDVIKIVDARDNLLFLNDGLVIAGVQVNSVSDQLLTQDDIEARLSAYRDQLLKRARFNWQWWIGTRPQVLDEHMAATTDRLIELVQLELALNAFARKVPDYVAAGEFSPDAFVAHFGHAPADFKGLPGGAHAVAKRLCDPASFTGAERDDVDSVEADIALSVRTLERWSDRVRENAEHLAHYTATLGTPVRTLYLIVSLSPRAVRSAAPLSEREVAHAGRELAEQCAFLMNGLEGVRVFASRASHDELLRLIQYFFHPASSGLAAAPAAARQSVALRIVSGEA